VLIELFSLVITAEALRVNIGSKSMIPLTVALTTGQQHYGVACDK